MSNKNNFKKLLEEEERQFEASGLREVIDKKLNHRFAFLRLMSDLAELFTVRVMDVMIMMSDEDIEPGVYFTPALKSDLETAMDKLIEQDVERAISRLKELIDQRSEKYPQLLVLEARAQQSSSPTEEAKAVLGSRLKAFITSLSRNDLR